MNIYIPRFLVQLVRVVIISQKHIFLGLDQTINEISHFFVDQIKLTPSTPLRVLLVLMSELLSSTLVVLFWTGLFLGSLFILAALSMIF